MDRDTYEDMLIERDGAKAWELQASQYTIDDVIEEDLKKYVRRAKEAERITFESEETKVVLNKLELLAEDELLDEEELLDELLGV